MDEWHPCEETEQSTQDVLLNFPVDQITWKNPELAVCDIFKVELNSEADEAKQSELNVWNQEKSMHLFLIQVKNAFLFIR